MTTIRTIAQKLGLPIRKTEKAVSTYRKSLVRTLLSKGRVWIPGLGTIRIKRLKTKMIGRKSFKKASIRLSKTIK